LLKNNKKNSKKLLKRLNNVTLIAMLQLIKNHQLIHKNSNVSSLKKTKKSNKELLEYQEKLKQSRLKLINVLLKSKRKLVFKDKKRQLNTKKL
jgi:hypothetical protein